MIGLAQCYRKGWLPRVGDLVDIFTHGGRCQTARVMHLNGSGFYWKGLTGLGWYCGGHMPFSRRGQSWDWPRLRTHLITKPPKQKTVITYVMALRGDRYIFLGKRPRMTINARWVNR